MDELKVRREEHVEENRKRDERKRAAHTIKELQNKKVKVLQDAATATSLIDNEIVELEKCIKT